MVYLSLYLHILYSALTFPFSYVIFYFSVHFKPCPLTPAYYLNSSQWVILFYSSFLSYFFNRIFILLRLCQVYLQFFILCPHICFHYSSANRYSLSVFLPKLSLVGQSFSSWRFLWRGRCVQHSLNFCRFKTFSCRLDTCRAAWLGIKSLAWTCLPWKCFSELALNIILDNNLYFLTLKLNCYFCLQSLKIFFFVFNV